MTLIRTDVIARDAKCAVVPNLRLSIARRLRRHPLFSEYAILPDPPFRILVHQGGVLLVGSVRSDVEKRVLEQIARQAFESEQVVNRLQVGGR